MSSETSKPGGLTKDDLGKWYRDSVTGFQGAVTALCFDIGGSEMARIETGWCEPRWLETKRLAAGRKPEYDLTNPSGDPRRRVSLG